MSRNYKFSDNDKLYFISLAISIGGSIKNATSSYHLSKGNIFPVMFLAYLTDRTCPPQCFHNN